MPSSGVQTCALRSEEHTSELQSHDNLVCRLLLEKTLGAATPSGRAGLPRSTRDTPRPPLSLPNPPVPSSSYPLPAQPGSRAVSDRFFFFNDTAPTEIYPLSLPGPLPI